MRKQTWRYRPNAFLLPMVQGRLSLGYWLEVKCTSMGATGSTDDLQIVRSGVQAKILESDAACGT